MPVNGMSLKRFQYNTVGKSFQICIKNHIVLGEHSSAVYIQHHKFTLMVKR